MRFCLLHSPAWITGNYCHANGLSHTANVTRTASGKVLLALPLHHLGEAESKGLLFSLGEANIKQHN